MKPSLLAYLADPACRLVAVVAALAAVADGASKLVRVVAVLLVGAVLREEDVPEEPPLRRLALLRLALLALALRRLAPARRPAQLADPWQEADHPAAVV